MGSFKKSNKIYFIAVGILSLILGYYFLPWRYLGDNFYEVIPGKYYRSGRMKAESLENKIQQYHIKTIINLEGRRPGKESYEREVSIGKKYGIRHYFIRLSSKRELTRQQLLKLINIIEHAKTPVLIKCYYGVNRTGLVSVIVRILKKGEPLKVARKELSFQHGHIPWVKDTTIESLLNKYEDWLKRNNLKDSPILFKKWATEIYDKKSCNISFNLLFCTFFGFTANS